MLVIIRGMPPRDPCFIALLELDEAGDVVRAAGPMPSDVDHFVARVARLKAMGTGPFTPDDVVNWLVSDNPYCSWQTIAEGDFDAMYQKAAGQRFFARHRGHILPITNYEQVKDLMESYKWQEGKSAKSLAQAWVAAGGFPDAVRSVLETSSRWRDAEFDEGWFEHPVRLKAAGRSSVTDLMVYARLGDERGVIAVEGKAGEPFGDYVSDWEKKTDYSPQNRQKRLGSLCETLGLDLETARGLRYQLLHRTVSAIYEARSQKAKSALMLVHSFLESPESLADYLSFASALGLRDAGVNRISSPVEGQEIDLRLGWVEADRKN
jgi:hypothetical protein